MATFSIRLARRNVVGKPIPGRFVEFETDSASELANFYEKTTIAVRPGKRHNKVLAKKPLKNRRREKPNDAQLSRSGAGE